MRKEDRMELAISKMASLGLPEKFVRAVTQKALKTYGNWKFLEEDDYGLLADLCFLELEADSLAVQGGQSMVIRTSGVQDSPAIEHEFRARVDDNYTPKLRKVKVEPDSRTPKSKGKAPAVDTGPVPMDEEDTTCRKPKETPEERVTLRRPMEPPVTLRDTSGSSAPRLRACLGPGVRKFAQESPFLSEDDIIDHTELPVAEPSMPVQPSTHATSVKQPATVSNTDALTLLANVYPDEEDE